MNILINEMDTNLENTIKKVALYSTVAFFVLGGATHFTKPEYYMMMPNHISIPLELIYLSGFF